MGQCFTTLCGALCKKKSANKYASNRQDDSEDSDEERERNEKELKRKKINDMLRRMSVTDNDDPTGIEPTEPTDIIAKDAIRRRRNSILSMGPEPKPEPEPEAEPEPTPHRTPLNRRNSVDVRRNKRQR